MQSAGSALPVSTNLMTGRWSAGDDNVATVHACPVPVMTSPVFPSLDLDPDLGLTPEKPALNHRAQRHRDVRSKARQKVRFADNNSPGEKSADKVEKNTTYHHNKEKKFADGGNESIEIINIESENSLVNDGRLLDDEPLTIRYETTDSVNKYTRMIESGISMQSCIPALGDLTDKQCKYNNDSENGSEHTEHCLARPEFNSTLWMSKELQQLKSQTLDVAAAVEERLKGSQTTRQKIADKAYSKLNHHVVDQQFPELVSLEVPEDELVAMAAREQSAKVKPVKKDKTKSSKNVVPEMPDIYDFLTADLEKETASFSLEGVPSARPELRVAPPEAAFQIYKHIRLWENY